VAKKKILFPTDFSTASDVALEYATRMAKDNYAELLIVHVEEPPFAYGGGELYYGALEPDHSTLRNMLSALRPSDSSIPYEHRMLIGPPAEEIVRLAEHEQAELIVMGSHGRGGVARMLLGSVAEQVMRKAPCPVLIVKHPRHGRKK
jgi:nucleotide-binding universal stress UspA family protein